VIPRLPLRPAPLVPVLALLALLASGCGGGSSDSGGGVAGDNAGDGGVWTPRHLILITVDTLRADHLGCYGYPRETSPNVDRLADGGVLFERAIAQWPKTGPSFASFFIGSYPQTTGLTHKAAIRLPDGYLTLPELMADLGFETAAVISNAVLAQRLGWNRGFDEYLETWKLAPEVSDDPEEYRKWINAARVNELALPLLERRRDAERLFAWIHYSDPHAPYLLPADFDNPFLGDPYYVGDAPVELENPRATALGDERELRYYVAAYDANVLYADLRIGELLDRAAELGLLEDALVIFTADHGESLGEHGYYFGHGRLPHNQGSHVPLIFWSEGHLDGGRRIPQPVELVDLYPTLRDLFAPGGEIPGLEGQSLLGLLRPGDGTDADGTGTADGGPAYAFSEAGGGSPLTHFRSVQDERWKLVYHPPLEHRKRPRPESYELYDLEADPGETRNLHGEEEEQYRRLGRQLSSWMKGSQWIRRPADEVEAQSEETLKALKALGYVND
jgi:arylsulfatase A-like enzyme